MLITMFALVFLFWSQRNANCNLVMAPTDGSNYKNDCNNAHYADAFRGRGSAIMQNISSVITRYHRARKVGIRLRHYLKIIREGPTFLQVCDLHREARWRDVFHRRHPVLSGLLHLLVLHPKRLDGEAAVAARDPGHVRRRLGRRGDRGLVGGFGSCGGRKKTSSNRTTQRSSSTR